EQEPDAQQNDARFQPELVSLDTGIEQPRHADRVRDQQSERDRPQHVFDVRQRQRMGAAVAGNRLLRELAGVADDEQQRDARNDRQRASKGGALGSVGHQYGGIRGGHHAPPSITPSFTRATASSASSTASQSRETENRFMARMVMSCGFGRVNVAIIPAAG